MNSGVAKLVGHLMIGSVLGGVASAVVAALITVPYDPMARHVIAAYVIAGACASAYMAGDLG